MSEMLKKEWTPERHAELKRTGERHVAAGRMSGAQLLEALEWVDELRAQAPYCPRCPCQACDARHLCEHGKPLDANCPKCDIDLL